MRLIIQKPLITEKSLVDATNSKFTFVVERLATKTDIKKAVEAQFEVEVKAVATTIVKGQSKRAGRLRTQVKDEPWKKAIVKLKKGQKIALFDLGT